MPCSRSWGGVVSQHALQQVLGGCCIPACLAGLQAHTQEVEGSGLWRGVLQAHTQGGEIEGSGQGGFPGPHPRGYPSMH